MRLPHATRAQQITRAIRRVRAVQGTPLDDAIRSAASEAALGSQTPRTRAAQYDEVRRFLEAKGAKRGPSNQSSVTPSKGSSACMLL